MSAGLLNQIDAYFSDLDSAQGPVTTDQVADLLDNVREVPVALVPAQRMSRVWVAAAAFAGVIVLVGVVAWLAASGNSVPPADEPTVTTTPDEQVVESYYELDWTFVPRSNGLPLYVLEESVTANLVSTPTGLLMIHSNSPLNTHTLLRSADGREWSGEPLPGGKGPAYLRQVGDTFLVVGAGIDRRAFSSIDGTTWSEENANNLPNLEFVQYLGFDIESLQQVSLPEMDNPRTGTVVKIGDRFVAFSPTPIGSRDGWQAFTSENGTEWSSINLPEFEHLTARAHPQFAFLGLRDGVLIFSAPQDGTDLRATIMRSTDGLTWTEVTPTGVAITSGIKSVDGGWVAGGAENGEVEVPGGGTTATSGPLYFSIDGLEWAEIRIDNDPLTGPYFHVAAAGDTIIRVGDGAHSPRPDYQVGSIRSLTTVQSG